jgi:hypothetical protein
VSTDIGVGIGEGVTGLATGVISGIKGAISTTASNMFPGGFEADAEEILERGGLILAGAILMFLGLKALL